MSQHRDLGFRYLAENASNSGAGQLRIYGVGAIAGLATVGYVQAAGLLMGPFLVIFLGISLVTVPEATRVLRHSPRHLRLYCVLVGAGMAVLALVWGGALLIALPRGLGELLLGKELWRPASRLVVPFTISVMGACFIAGATAGLHALGAARRSLRAMVLSSVVFLGCGLVGAYYGGGARNGPRRCPSDVGWRAGVVVATGRGDAGIRQVPREAGTCSAPGRPSSRGSAVPARGPRVGSADRGVCESRTRCCSNDGFGTQPEVQLSPGIGQPDR